MALSALTLFVLCEPRNCVTLCSVKDPGGYSSENYAEVSGQKCDLNLYALGRAPWLMLLFVYLG